MLRNILVLVVVGESKRDTDLTMQHDPGEALSTQALRIYIAKQNKNTHVPFIFLDI